MPVKGSQFAASGVSGGAAACRRKALEVPALSFDAKPGPKGFFESMKICRARVKSADVWCKDLVEVQFSQPMRNEGALSQASHFTVTALDGGELSRVLQVVVPLPLDDYPTASEILLVVSRFTVGSKYRIDVADALRAADGSTLKPLYASATLVTRRTRVDEWLDRRQELYSTSPTSLHRMWLQIVMRRLELAGGSRNDVYP